MSLRVHEVEHCKDLSNSVVNFPRFLFLLVIGLCCILILRCRHLDLKKYVLVLILWIVVVVFSLQESGLLQLDRSTYASSDRLVFSFTTTNHRLNLTLRSLKLLLNQTSYQFDAVYVVVPRHFKQKEIQLPSWMVDPKYAEQLSSYSHTYASFQYYLLPTKLDTRLHVVVLEKDFGPSSKVLGTLLVETDPSTIIVYGDDDRVYPKELSSRAIYYVEKYPNDAIGVLGGWIGMENSLYCGRSIEFGSNRVSMLGGAGGVVVRRGWFQNNAFDVVNYSKPCFLGDDLYLSHLLSLHGISKRLVYDSCWNTKNLGDFLNLPDALSNKRSTHAGGPNVANYQQCMKTTLSDTVAQDVEFGYYFSYFLGRLWGIFRMTRSWYNNETPIPC